MAAKGALSGVRVVELAQWAAVPGAGAMLADWGAEVIHVEHPGHGDGQRGFIGAVSKGFAPASDIPYAWELINRNKKSFTVDVSKPEGREVLYKLLATADVFLSNLRPYELAKFGLEFEKLHAINPRLISANLTGYGPKGPNANLPGFDYGAFWARGGIMQMLPEPGMNPTAARPALGDFTSAIAVACSVLVGLMARERLGIVQEVNVSLFGTAMWVLAQDLMASMVTGLDFRQHPRSDMPNALANFYRTKDDRWIFLTCMQPDAYWPRVCAAIERPELATDPRFATFKAKLENHAEMIALLDEVFATKTKDDWKARLDAQGIPWSPAQTPTEVVTDPQAIANEYVVPFDHPTYGPLRYVASPVKLSETPATIRSQAPELGEHNEELLLEMGYDWEQIGVLKEQGVVI